MSSQWPDDMARKLASSGIPKDFADSLGMLPAPCLVPGAAAVKQRGILIPYYHPINKKPVGYYDLRRLPCDTGPKYICPEGSTPHVYFPRTLDWRSILKHPGTPVILTEGALKAASAAETGLPTISIGGVDMWQARGRGIQLLGEFELLGKDRILYIVYDSDAASNPHVARAENALCWALTGKGIRPRIVRLPPGKDGKLGLDDYLVAYGRGELEKLLVESIEWSMSRELYAMNERYLFVESPTSVLDLCTGKPETVTANNFLVNNTNKSILVVNGDKPKTVNLGKAWLAWPHRSTVHSQVYEPGQDRISKSNYNLWNGWGVESAAGDAGPWTGLLDRLFRGAPPENRQWFERWLAYPVQYPGTKLYTSAILWSREGGVGKSLLAELMGDVYGENHASIGNQELESAFNDWGMRKSFVYAEEISLGHSPIVYHKLKSMITAQFRWNNQKYVPVFRMRDTINYLFLSNQCDAIYLDAADRRFFVHSVTGDPEPDEFYGAISAWRKAGGARHLRYHLEHLDLGGFNPHSRAPMTEAKMEMSNATCSDHVRWIRDLRVNPSALGERILWTSQQLLGLYDPQGRMRLTVRGLAKSLSMERFEQVEQFRSHEDERIRPWVMQPTLLPTPRPRLDSEWRAFHQQEWRGVGGKVKY